MTRARDELILTHAADYGGARARRVSPFVLEALDLPVGFGRGGERRPSQPSAGPADRVRGAARRHRAAADRTDRGAAHPELRPDRRLPDVPAEVQVQPRPARAGRAAPRDDLRLGAPQGRAGVPSPPCPGRRHERGRARSTRSRSRGATRASSRASTKRRAWTRAAPRCAGSAPSSSSRARGSRPTSSASSRSRFNGDRIRGRWDRVDIEPVVEALDPAPRTTASRAAGDEPAPRSDPT